MDIRRRTLALFPTFTFSSHNHRYTIWYDKEGVLHTTHYTV